MSILRMTREEYESKYGTTPTTPVIPRTGETEGVGGFKGVALGAAKGATGSFLGLGSLVGKGVSAFGKLSKEEDMFDRLGSRIEGGYESLKPTTVAKGGAEKTG